MYEEAKGFSDPISHRPACDCIEGRIQGGECSVRVDGKDNISCCFHQISIGFFRFPQRLLRSFEFGDVAQDVDKSGDLSFGRFDWIHHCIKGHFSACQLHRLPHTAAKRTNEWATLDMALGLVNQPVAFLTPKSPGILAEEFSERQ